MEVGVGVEGLTPPFSAQSVATVFMADERRAFKSESLFRGIFECKEISSGPTNSTQIRLRRCKHPRRRLSAEEVADHARQVLCRGSRDAYIVDWRCTSEACRLIAVAAWVRRFPSRASKSSVRTLYSQRIHLNCIPPTIRLVVQCLTL